MVSSEQENDLNLLRLYPYSTIQLDLFSLCIWSIDNQFSSWVWLTAEQFESDQCLLCSLWGETCQSQTGGSMSLLSKSICSCEVGLIMESRWFETPHPQFYCQFNYSQGKKSWFIFAWSSICWMNTPSWMFTYTEGCKTECWATNGSRIEHRTGFNGNRNNSDSARQH